MWLSNRGFQRRQYGSSRKWGTKSFCDRSILRKWAADTRCCTIRAREQITPAQIRARMAQRFPSPLETIAFLDRSNRAMQHPIITRFGTSKLGDQITLQ